MAELVSIQPAAYSFIECPDNEIERELQASALLLIPARDNSR